jgi:DNA helicase-2/ATP-dependent DNA helicase PcrA
VEAPDGEVALLRFPGQKTEAEGIAELAKQLIEKDGLEPQDILVLLRGDHNAQFSSSIKDALDDQGIPCTDPEAVKRVLADPNNRWTLEALRLAENADDSIAWASILHLSEGISNAFVDRIYEVARDKGSSFSAAMKELRDAEFPDCPRPSAKKAGEVIIEISDWLQEIDPPNETPNGGWGQWIVGASGSDALRTPTDDLVELLSDLDGLDEPSQPLGRYLGQITPHGKDLATEKGVGVRVMSMASSKGLTVRATIVAAVENDIIPRPEAPIAEERRLLYVAMTRSTEFLFVTWAGTRRGPTARSGAGQANARRHHSRFLDGGPVKSESGQAYLAAR